MRRSSFVAVLVCLMLVPALSEAQTMGTVELMGFGRWTRISPDRDLKNAIGVGAGFGLFLSSRFKLTGDASYGPTSQDSDDASAAYMPFHARLVYEQPLGDKLRATLGGGYVFNNYIDQVGDDHGWTAAAGANWKLGAKTRLFAQGSMDYLPANWNDLTVIVINPTGVIRIIERGDIHWAVEAGISGLFG